MKVYVAGPMRGYPLFNFPAFHAAQEKLEKNGHVVFNPARRDEEKYGASTSDSATGDLAEAEAKGFNLREALGADLAWICGEADAIYMLKGWEFSSGAVAEHATAKALGLEIIYQVSA